MTKAEKFNKTELFARVKEYLTMYKFYRKAIERAKEELAHIEQNIDGLNGTDYSTDRVSGTPQGDGLTSLISNKMKLEHKIQRLSNICDNIDKIYEILDEPKKTIIRMKYMETRPDNKKSWIAIAYETNYSERHCKRLRNEAINEIIIMFE